MDHKPHIDNSSFDDILRSLQAPFPIETVRYKGRLMIN